MRSRNADRFNHDEDAPDYDEDVADESDPIRAGYGETLRWVAARAQVSALDSVLELGSGTGNLTALLPRCRRVVAVDVSREMASIARAKLGERDEIEWLEDDGLSFVSRSPETFDVVTSTYALHHLTEEEKGIFARLVLRRLAPAGRIAFGDLMFESPAERARIVGTLRARGDDAAQELVETVEDEFFWDLSAAVACWQDLGFEVETRRISLLSWGLAAWRRAPR
jgi:putative AdoMet-dependent methyltransferase